VIFLLRAQRVAVLHWKVIASGLGACQARNCPMKVAKREEAETSSGSRANDGKERSGAAMGSTWGLHFAGSEHDQLNQASAVVAERRASHGVKPSELLDGARLLRSFLQTSSNPLHQ
jgi:hypothetical protein